MSFDLKQFLESQTNLKIEKVAFDQNSNAIHLAFEGLSLVSAEDEIAIQESIKRELKFIEAVTTQIRYRFECSPEQMFNYAISKMVRSDRIMSLVAKMQVTVEPNGIKWMPEDPGTYYQVLNLKLEDRITSFINDRFSKAIRIDIVEPADLVTLDDEAINERMINMVEASKPSYVPKEDRPVAKKSKEVPEDELVIYKRAIKTEPSLLTEQFEEEQVICIEGEAFSFDSRVLSSGKTIFSFALSDHTDAIKCKVFLDKKDAQSVPPRMSSGNYYRVEGRLRYDTYEKDTILNILAINAASSPEKRKDTSDLKRIELHAHTNMSAMDATPSAKAMVKRAISWGHPAIAITDHGVIQSFPDAMNAAGKDIKVIYGVEGYLVNDDMQIVENVHEYGLNDTFIVFDIETTGFSPRYDGITEIGAVKIRNGEVIDRFSRFVNPEKQIPQVVVELTGITDEMVMNEPTISEILPEFIAFCEGCPVVAHNAKFDMSFMREKARLNGLTFEPMVLCTLKLSRMIMKELGRHKLNYVAKKLGIKLENHHRAVHDAAATAKIFARFVEMLSERDVCDIDQLIAYGKTAMDMKDYDSYHVILLVKNYAGLRNLYEMISHSHIKTFYRKPLIPKSLLNEKREGILIGSACEAGEVYQAILAQKEDDEVSEIAQFYDYLEVQPVGNNQFLIEKGLVKDVAELQQINRKIIDLAKEQEKPCVATSDSHFLDPEDEVYRRILMAGQGFKDADNQPPLYLKTTQEMLDEFSYLDKETAEEVVIHATHKVNDMIESILPVPDGTFPPEIEGSNEELREMCYQKAKRIYGEPLPDIVEKRLERELQSIIGNGYAVMYIIAQKLVTKSMEDGYLVGSRGSVGSSFAATMSDITEVNPLPPHYHCRSCLYSEFITDGSIASGADLKDKTCPKCGDNLKKDGHDIPFETFLGFEGDKEPDIDLNFAGVYQATSHAYTEELFGEGFVYKAGTIGTVAEKTAFGFVKKYVEEKEKKMNYHEVVRLAQGCVGVRRTSGQHPGGIMVIPHYKNVHDFTPIQYPANDSSSGVITTHFDYHSISGRILKLDILGHDVPTIIKMTEDFTGIDAMEIPLDDPDTLKIFTSVKSLKIVDKDYPIKIGSLGIPEFGTKFVRQMLVDTQPTSFAELVQISGLSHGTDVWINNAADLVADGIVSLKDVIGTRDDIMVYLMYAGLPPKDSFFIMEGVRKGKGLKPEQEEQMRSFNVPKWYIESCKKIKYMFPKAHAVAYVMMSVRIAYFKVHHPLAFYATFFTIKVDDFDAHLVSQGRDAIKQRMQELEEIPKMSTKEQNQYTILEATFEMYARGFACKPVHLYNSDAEKFKIEDGQILPPLRALQGVGENAAKSIVAAREESEFISINDVKTRGKANRSVIEALVNHGVLRGLPESNQLSFDMFLTDGF
ncbi:MULTISPECIES: PolC-type DNA polymerase III [unclassified Fusibacter]|uniref:PolC-type DNA polymerase III n=1 Tax=unclassified Fusibacter TaxID=2624464 RepID=UPI001FAAC559|nr:PolC-type DNA polymerase III [Fusibacter sp. A1]MCK8058798.1 PolC-type DNA polymerase III [Fusibacter sp. A2]